VRATPDGEVLLSELRRDLFIAVTTITDAVGENRLGELADVLDELAMVEPRGHPWLRY
jgi:hypothetical protein